MNDGEDPAKRLERLERLKAKHGNGNGAGRNLGSEVQTWATPRASMVECGSDSGSAQRLAQGANPGLKDQGKAWATPVAGDERASASQGTVSLGRQVRRDVAGWPTATVGDSASSGSAGYGTASGRSEGTTLTDAAVGPRGPLARTTPPAGESTSPPTRTPRLLSLALNPYFVEALMGFPLGWTLITATASTDSGASATPSSLTAPPSPGSSSGTA
jgi:hypothetical protein